MLLLRVEWTPAVPRKQQCSKSSSQVWQEPKFILPFYTSVSDHFFPLFQLTCLIPPPCSADFVSPTLEFGCAFSLFMRHILNSLSPIPTQNLLLKSHRDLFSLPATLYLWFSVLSLPCGSSLPSLANKQSCYFAAIIPCCMVSQELGEVSWDAMCRSQPWHLQSCTT